MRLIIFDTPEGQTRGLQYRQYIEPGTLFVFPLIHEDTLFHSRNVREDFDLAFIAQDMTILWKGRIHPEKEVALAPKGTFMALESKAGEMDRWGFRPGRRARF